MKNLITLKNFMAVIALACLFAGHAASASWKVTTPNGSGTVNFAGPYWYSGTSSKTIVSTSSGASLSRTSSKPGNYTYTVNTAGGGSQSATFKWTGSSACAGGYCCSQSGNTVTCK